MSQHHSPTIERHCDVAIIGASAAGLAAALQLSRQRRSVIVVDSGEPRNASATHMHSYLGHEGMPPAQFAALGREEVRSYGGEVIEGRATGVTRDDDGRFVVQLVGGHRLTARRVLAATGLVDELPEIDGLAPHWGVDVIHCPFCHGYEVRDKPIVQIITNEMGLHTATLFRQQSSDLTLVLHQGVAANHPGLDRLRSSGVKVVDQAVTRVVTGADGRIAAVEIADGVLLETGVVVVGSRFRARAEILAPLGIVPVPHPTGLGDAIETGPTGETSAPGVYAAGNLTDPSQQVLGAAAQGSRVAGMIAFSLAEEDIATTALPSGNERDWDHRYGGEQIWSGNPNGALVHEVTSMAPGRALDVGAGEGGDAVWLAERGWNVTATDISARALNRISAVAKERDLRITCRHADANALHAYDTEKFDLVSAHYASIPRTPDQRGLTNILDAVAPGGTLLIVSHDISAMRSPIDTNQQSRPFDPDAYVRVEDFRPHLSQNPAWTVELDETRERPTGAASHHVHDLVLRARRLSN